MGLDESGVGGGDSGGGGGGLDSPSLRLNMNKNDNMNGVACSICLEVVTDNGDRSWAKLQCTHLFHLDCIGSAFNIKGAMQCPNCRKIEKGQWLYATGCRSITDFVEDWPHDEDLYDIGYSEMFGVQWCPLPAFSRLPSFEEGEFPLTTYHDLLGQHAVLAEHTAVSSSTHQCPYVAAYYGPLHSSSSNSAGSVSDGSSFSNGWGSPPGPSEIQPSYAFAAMDPHYHGWEPHSMPFSAPGNRLGGSDQSSIQPMSQRLSRASSDLPRSGSNAHQFVMGHSSGGRVGSSVTSSMVPPYPGSAARARDRVQALQAYFQPPSSSPPVFAPMMSGTRRSNGHRGVSQMSSMPSSSDQTGGFYVFSPGTSNRSFPESDNPMSSRFHAWEREHMSSFPLAQGERDWAPHPTIGGPSSFRQRHGSEWTPSENRS